MQGGGIVVRQAVRLARGDRVRLTIPVPILGDNENIRFEIREDGRTLERFNYTGFQSGSLPGDASALIVADRSSPFGTMAAGWPRPMTAGGRSTFVVRRNGDGWPGGLGLSRRAGEPPPLDFLLAPARLPTNWLGLHVAARGRHRTRRSGSNSTMRRRARCSHGPRVAAT